MAYERLSSQDAVFLQLEEANAPMHVGAVALFGPTSVRGPGEAVSIEAVRSLVASRLPRLPRYRMRLAWTPVTADPVWVDDPFLDLTYHVRHVSLPREGDAQAFKELAAGFLSQKLDRARPLWEILVVSGLESGRIGAVFKAHHALIDGISGVDILILLLGIAPETNVPEAPRWEPREIPAGLALFQNEMRRRAALPLGLVAAAREALRNPRESLRAARDHALGVGHLLQLAFTAGSETPLSGDTGPNRRLATMRVELGDIKRIKRGLGGTVNDAVMAIVAGALRRFFEIRGVRADGLDVKAMIPVSTRSDVERGTLGNKLAVVSASLPVGEPDPRKRLARVRSAMDAMKSSKVALGNEVFTRIADWTSPQLLSGALKAAMRFRSVHLMVTNMRGPAEPLYFLDAPLLEVYPAAPLWPGQSLNVAVMSYRGFLHWGIGADANAVPDVETFLDAIRAETQDLCKLALEVEEAGPSSS